MPAPQSETSVVEREIRIDAPPETVFLFFTDPEKLVRWLGVGATLDPRPGGVFNVNTITDYSLAGEYVAVEPYSRIVFTWGYGDFPGREPPTPRVEHRGGRLVPDGESTIVRLRHRVPAELADFHTMGWEHYLGRLAVAATGGDPGPDPFREALELMTGTD